MAVMPCSLSSAAIASARRWGKDGRSRASVGKPGTDSCGLFQRFAAQATAATLKFVGYKASHRPVAGTIGVIAIGFFISADQPQCRNRPDGNVGRCLKLARPEIAIFDPAFNADIVEFRPLRADRDHAARRILAEQRTLRAAQNFHLGHIKSVEQLGLNGSNDEIIDQSRDRGLEIDNDRRLNTAPTSEAGNIETGNRRRPETGDKSSDFTPIAG